MNLPRKGPEEGLYHRKVSFSFLESIVADNIVAPSLIDAIVTVV